MKLTHWFEQYALLQHQNNDEAKKGICLRLAFKWAACKAVGQDFKFLDLNKQRSADKFVHDYLEPLRNDRFPYFNSQQSQERRILKGSQIPIPKWARKFTSANGTKHSVIPGALIEEHPASYLSKNPIEKTEGLIIGMSGKHANGEYWGHAVALYGGANPRFFDPNDGEFEFETDNIGEELRAGLARRYPNATNFAVMPISGVRDLCKQRDELQKQLQQPMDPETRSQVTTKLRKVQDQLRPLGYGSPLSPPHSPPVYAPQPPTMPSPSPFPVPPNWSHAPRPSVNPPVSSPQPYNFFPPNIPHSSPTFAPPPGSSVPLVPVVARAIPIPPSFTFSSPGYIYRNPTYSPARAPAPSVLVSQRVLRRPAVPKSENREIAHEKRRLVTMANRMGKNRGVTIRGDSIANGSTVLLVSRDKKRAYIADTRHRFQNHLRVVMIKAPQIIQTATGVVHVSELRENHSVPAGKVVNSSYPSQSSARRQGVGRRG